MAAVKRHRGNITKVTTVLDKKHKRK